MSSLEPEAPYRGCLEVEACSDEELLRVNRGPWRGPSDFESPGVRARGMHKKQKKRKQKG